jgi:hypothetical protein
MEAISFPEICPGISSFVHGGLRGYPGGPGFLFLARGLMSFSCLASDFTFLLSLILDKSA